MRMRGAHGQNRSSNRGSRPKSTVSDREIGGVSDMVAVPTTLWTSSVKGGAKRHRAGDGNS